MEPINPYAAPSAESAAMTIAAPPITFGQVLATGTTVFFRRFPAFAAIMLVVWGPVELLQSYLDYYVLDPEDIGASFRLATTLDALFGIIATGAVVQLGVKEMRGEHCPWWSALVLGLRAWPRLFATRLVSGILLLIAALLLILPALYFAVRFSLAETAAVVENRAGTGATNRSMELTRGKFWWYLALAFATVGPQLLFGIAAQMPVIFVPGFDYWVISAGLHLAVGLGGSLGDARLCRRLAEHDAR